MAFISKLLATGAGLSKSITGGIGGRMMLGGGIGAVAGAFGATNYNDSNQQINSILTGAAAGAFAGAATRLITPAIRYGKEGAMTTGIPIGLKAGMKGLGLAGKTGFGAAKFAIKHPRVTLATAGAGLGAYAASNFIGTQTSTLDQGLDDPMTSNNPLGENAAMSQMNMGLSPMGSMTTGTSIRSSRMQQSTFGLVQGLSRGRH